MLNSFHRIKFQPENIMSYKDTIVIGGPLENQLCRHSFIGAVLRTVSVDICFVVGTLEDCRHRNYFRW